MNQIAIQLPRNSRQLPLLEKYRVKQDKLYKTDFDLLLEESSKVKDNKQIEGENNEE